MKKFNLLLVGLLVVLTLVSFASAGDVSVNYFYGEGCHVCAAVAESGLIDRVDGLEGVSVEKFEVYHDDSGREKYIETVSGFGISQYDWGVPFVAIECENDSTYIMGGSMIDSLEEKIVTCEQNGGDGNVSPIDPNAHKITLWSLIVAALIDSINPCAFGVLIFLMLSLLNMGSAKRALRAGLLYTFVVFVVYFFAGFGIFSAIQQFTSVTYYIYMFSGVLVLVLGLWQFKDVFFPKIGPTLQISSKAKPLMEKIIRKGTLPAMVLLGIVVSLFELPCTGGIYLGILTMMSINKTFAVSYLLIYNLIFVLPLVILTFLIYRGMSPRVLQKWTQGERKWMKLGAGVVLVLLGLYILLF
ncbi:hypothetical protein HN935_02715 [archaeon]|jgi:cytochrome c biogenesis protein CcdA|nr:hypothetical protein [archaeon]